MAKRVEVGSEWFIVSQSWINKWQKFVGFDDGVSNDINPGKMDNSDIIEPFCKDNNGQVQSCFLAEMSIKYLWQNYQLKKNLKEGEDYMLVDHNIHKFWSAKYGEKNQIKRFGIEDEAGE